MTRRLRRATRRGLSLLEVVLAMAILLVSMVALGQLVGLGLDAANRSRDLTYAQMLCESKMAELVSGLVPLEPAMDMPVGQYLDQSFSAADFNEWLCTVQIEPDPMQPELLVIGVTVYRNPMDDTTPVEFTLVRLIRDPSMTPGAMGMGFP